jgi:DNA polymerase-4
MAGVETAARPLAWPRSVVHVDMDAFYVNVHLLDHPEDTGLPLVVGGRPESRGVVSSASYEARRLGIHSAMATSHALRLVPGLLIVAPDWPRIKACSRQVMGVLGAFGTLEQMSVDEAYIDIDPAIDPPAVARQAQAQVISETALPCSVGLATNKLVAKVASDFNKPRGYTVVPPGTEAAFLAPLSVRAIWGIGPRTAERLAALGILTCGDLAAYDPERLRGRFGREAESLQRRARGVDSRPVEAERGPSKSISQEWTFSRDVNDPAVLREQLGRQAADVAKSLREEGLLAHTIRIKLRWPDFTTFTRQRSLDTGTDDPATIERVALALLEEHRPAGQAVRLLGVGVSGLRSSEGRQLGFGF